MLKNICEQLSKDEFLQWKQAAIMFSLLPALAYTSKAFPKWDHVCLKEIYKQIWEQLRLRIYMHRPKTRRC